jgi:hypothetical protein
MTELSAWPPANLGGTPEMLFARQRQNEFNDLPT